MSQSFLFLQGPHGPFFRQLGRRLAAAGHRVTRVNFNGGDVIDWPCGGTVSFRAPPALWPQRLATLAAERGVTDLVLYGDCRPFHRTAIDQLRPRGVRVHVFEEGYLRPDWVTLEADGVNGHSRLVFDPDRLRAEAALPPAERPALPPLRPTTPAMLRLCTRHYLARACLSPWFAHYRSHRPQPALRELRGWLARFRRRRFGSAAEARRIESVIAEPAPMFLFPLQLDSDAQIRCHSPFAGMLDAIELVIASFARAAPPAARLVVKNHPLDTGTRDLRRPTADLASRHGCAGRVVFIEGGHLPTLLRCAQGVVCVNSTSGLQAIHHGRPTKVLGHAVYALPGLVDPQPLDRFWRDPTPPDPLLYRGLRRRLMLSCQFNGSFYTAEGRARLLPAVTARLTEASAARTGAARRGFPDRIGDAEPWTQPWPAAA